MFERRLKIFLGFLLALTGFLVLRAVQIQVLARGHWAQEEVETMKRPRDVETTRGTIRDVRGRALAFDEACVEACVDYGAILDPPDPGWLADQAHQRLSRRLGVSYTRQPRDRRKQMRGPEIEKIKSERSAMWIDLAAESGQTVQQIDEVRRTVIQKVKMQQRVVWYARYRAAMRQHGEREPSAWLRRWLIDETQRPPQVDNFYEDVAEQSEAHAIIPYISNDTLIRLKKNLEKYPGLRFRDGTFRHYPYGDSACYVIGHLSRVLHEDIENDPELGVNPLRQYQLNDLIGRAGLEALCERQLRGTRGQVVRITGKEGEFSRLEPLPGADVTTTLDIELQSQIESLFKQVRIDESEQRFEMHGAAVVLDIPSGEVRALASHPRYDLNQFEKIYPVLAIDEINQPLLNRATQWATEPGSTIKPIVGLGAVTDGLLPDDEGIECTGYLIWNNHKISEGFRCWVASKWAKTLGDEGVKHHPFPVPHPTGYLTFADAVERSCNVYFETVAGRLGMARLSEWFSRFGLGTPTGLGIAEWSGRVPDPSETVRDQMLSQTWSAGIGQGPVSATPIQMANVAATIARDGVLVRPRLVQGADASPSDLPDRVDLKLSPIGLNAAKDGMTAVVNSPAGTVIPAQQRILQSTGVKIAGKTGTAQAAPFRPKQRDEQGQLVFDEAGNVQRISLEPSTEEFVNDLAPWYRAFGKDKELKHAWFIGYAPAENPKIAFAVMIEYGGSGGMAAVSVAKGLIDACVKHGYLSP